MSAWRRIFQEHRRLIVPLAAALAVNIGVLAGVVLPLSRVVASAQEEQQTARLDMFKATARERNVQQAGASRDRAQKELAKFYKDVLPVDQATAVHIEEIELARLAKDAGLPEPERQTYTPERNKDSRLVQLKSEATLIGDYNRIRHFLYSLETAEPFLIVDEVALAPAKIQGAGASGTLQVVVSISTYYVAQ